MLYLALDLVPLQAEILDQAHKVVNEMGVPHLIIFPDVYEKGHGHPLMALGASNEADVPEELELLDEVVAGDVAEECSLGAVGREHRLFEHFETALLDLENLEETHGFLLEHGLHFGLDALVVADVYQQGEVHLFLLASPPQLEVDFALTHAHLGGHVYPV